MKKLLTIIIILAAFAAQAQKTIPQITLFDTTRADGQRIIVQYPVGAITFGLRDSLNVISIPAGGAATGTITETVIVPNYCSVNDSRIQLTCKKTRIVNQDTLITYPTVSVPINLITTGLNSYLSSTTLKTLMKPTAREWAKAKLKDN